jgi:CRISPR-associated protein Csb2
VARFAIRSAVPPRIQEALEITDRLRIAVMSKSAKVSGDPRPVFSGHGADGRHGHALYLACDDDSDGFIDHLMVQARAGFEEEDVVALQSLRRVWGKGGHDTDLILVGLGASGDFGGVGPVRTRTLSKCRVWESLTPFVPTRHPKTVRGVEVDGIPDQLRRACEQFLGGVSPKSVSSIGDRASWSRFRRRRLSGGGRRGPDWAFGVRLVFDEPVQGPIALGYGAHFGLGLFVGVEDALGRFAASDGRSRISSRS